MGEVKLKFTRIGSSTAEAAAGLVVYQGMCGGFTYRVIGTPVVARRDHSRTFRAYMFEHPAARRRLSDRVHRTRAAAILEASEHLSRRLAGCAPEDVPDALSDADHAELLASGSGLARRAIRRAQYDALLLVEARLQARGVETLFLLTDVARRLGILEQWRARG